MSATRFNKGLSVTNKGADVDSVIVEKTRSISIAAGDGTSENQTSFTLPGTAIVKAVYLRVKTAEATGTTKTINVGTLSTDSGDADGFIAGADVSATGLVKGTLANAGQTLGALLYTDEGGTGQLVPEVDVASGGKVITWTPASANFAELEADIIIDYQEIVEK